jgi:UDP-glucose 4-epimerase
VRILVTGVAGFIGSRLAEWILANVPDAEIIGVDDFSFGYEENVPREVHFLRGTLGHGAILPRQKPFDLIFHFAATACEGLSPWIRLRNYRDNLLATAEVVNHAIEWGCGRLVFTSSMAVYGRQPCPFYEFARPMPIDPYGVAKSASEADIQIAGEQHGLDWCIVRPHNFYGPGQSIWQRYRNVLGHWMARHWMGEPLLVYGDGSQVRAFSYIDDALPCLWRAATDSAASKQIINLGGIQPVTILEAARSLAEILPEASIHHAQPRHEVHTAWCSWRKSVELLGFEHKTSLADGLTEYVRWAEAAWYRWPERRDTHRAIQREATRGIYEYWA